MAGQTVYQFRIVRDGKKYPKAYSLRQIKLGIEQDKVRTTDRFDLGDGQIVSLQQLKELLQVVPEGNESGSATSVAEPRMSERINQPREESDLRNGGQENQTTMKHPNVEAMLEAQTETPAVRNEVAAKSEGVARGSERVRQSHARRCKDVDSSRDFDLNKAWEQIDGVPSPDRVFLSVARKPKDAISGQPLVLDRDSMWFMRYNVAAIAICSAMVTLPAIFFPRVALFSIPMTLVFAAWWFLMKVRTPIWREWWKRRQELRRKRLELEHLKDEQVRSAKNFLAQFVDKKRQLEQCKNEIGGLDYQLQLRNYLDSHRICDADIPGIGEKKIQSLAQHGYTTARSVEPYVESVTGIGDSLTRDLCNWRARVEHRFRYKPTPIDIVSLQQACGRDLSPWLREIQIGTLALTQITETANREVHRLDVTIAQLEYDVAQAEADLFVAVSYKSRRAT